MPELGELDDFLDPDLKLTVKGRKYVIAPPSAEMYLLCQSLMQRTAGALAGVHGADLSTQLLDDDDEAGLFQRLCGSTWQLMLDDQVDPVRMRHVGLTVFFWVAVGEAMAIAHYRNALGGALAADLPASPSPTTPSPTAAATTTRPPASTSGTSSPST